LNIDASTGSINGSKISSELEQKNCGARLTQDMGVADIDIITLLII